MSVVSLGDYVLNGGEVAVLAMVEAVARLLPGVIGNAESLVEESHEDGLLEYPVYTKPAVLGVAPGRPAREVPPVLLSGDHGAIAAWRHQQRLERTAARRPDLLHASQAADGLEDLDLAVATAADAPELMVLTRACWVARDRPLRHVRRGGGDAATRWSTRMRGVDRPGRGAPVDAWSPRSGHGSTPSEPAPGRSGG